MNDGYALLATRIAAAYPAAFISDLTLVDWTQRLSELDPPQARAAAERLSNLERPPSPWDFRDARRAVKTTYFKALPAGPPPELTPEQKANFERVKALLRDKAIGRSYPAALEAVPDSELDTDRPIPASVRLGCPVTEGIRDGKHLLCSVCRDDLCPDCIPVPRAQRNCHALSHTSLDSMGK